MRPLITIKPGVKIDPKDVAALENHVHYTGGTPSGMGRRKLEGTKIILKTGTSIYVEPESPEDIENLLWPDPCYKCENGYLGEDRDITGICDCPKGTELRRKSK